MEFDSCLIPSWVHSLSRFSFNQQFLSFHYWATEFAGGNTTIMWTSASTNLWFPSSQNHSAIPHSAGQLPLPLPTAALPNFSSCPKGPTQFFPCLKLLSRNSFKEPLDTIEHALLLTYFPPQTRQMFNQHLPSVLRPRGYLSISPPQG